MKKRISTNPSVEYEPGGCCSIDPSEDRVEDSFWVENDSEESRVQQCVLDEPAFSFELTQGKVVGDVSSYADWIDFKASETSHFASWLVVLGVSLISGIWAILGTLLLALAGYGFAGIAAMIISGPIIEEIMKVSAPLLIVEKRAYLFKRPS